MFSSFVRPCFTCDSYVDTKFQKPFPRNVKVLRQTHVSQTQKTLTQQLLTPLDLFPFCFQQYLPWAVFFNYDIEFQRLVDALHAVAQKYLLLCGRLSTDDKGRYVIEVGSTNRRRYDFPVCEMKAELQMAEAILQHGKITTDSAEYPVHPNKLPFYLESLNLEAIHKGQDSFLSVKLTHFTDGCCLAISMSHILVDGMRFSELYRDISRAYCGKEVSVRDINREHMLFEEFSEHFSPEDKARCATPETMPTGREPLNLKQYPNESSSVEVLHLSKEMIDDLKLRVAPFIPEGSFVSTADLTHSLIWMLSCELNTDSGEIATGSDLDIAGTSSSYVAELCCNGHGIIPKSYLGNGVINPRTVAGEDFNSQPLLQLLTSLALLTREKQIELKKQPQQVLNILVDQYTPFSSLAENSRSSVSNFCKFAISDTDFGGGLPALFLCYSGLPFTGALWFVNTVYHDGGILLTQTITSKQKERLQKSSVLKECVPRIRSLFDDFGTTELSRVMKQQ